MRLLEHPTEYEPFAVDFGNPQLIGTTLQNAVFIYDRGKYTANELFVREHLYGHVYACTANSLTLTRPDSLPIPTATPTPKEP